MKEYIASVIEPHGLKIGCYHNGIDKLTKRQVDRVLQHLDTGDVIVYIAKRRHVVEKAVVDNELDLSIQTTSDYEGQYGRQVGKDY